MEMKYNTIFIYDTYKYDDIKYNAEFLNNNKVLFNK